MSAAASIITASGCSVLSGAKMKTGTIARKKLGKTGIDVSQFGFGSHLKAELIKNPNLRDRMIKTGFERGISTFDVYDHAGYKQFEPMGKSVRGFRKEAVISLCAVRSIKEMQAEIDDALQKFYTDYIDLYRTQTLDEERIAILDKNKKSGKIRAIGVVSHDAVQLSGFVEKYKDDLDFVMIVYNFHHNIGRPKKGSGMPPNDYTALIPRCSALGMGILGIKPMGSDDMVAYALNRGYYKKGPSLSHASLRHAFANDQLDCVMTAMNNPGELAANLEAAYKPHISAEEEDFLKALSRDADSMRAEYLTPKYRWLENWAVRTV
jgi:aryl-alcohol dehydrogenase-like predicted oxidoreductase